jgi:hypothetical protein
VVFRLEPAETLAGRACSQKPFPDLTPDAAPATAGLAPPFRHVANDLDAHGGRRRVPVSSACAKAHGLVQPKQPAASLDHG